MAEANKNGNEFAKFRNFDLVLIENILYAQEMIWKNENAIKIRVLVSYVMINIERKIPKELAPKFLRTNIDSTYTYLYK